MARRVLCEGAGTLGGRGVREAVRPGGEKRVGLAIHQADQEPGGRREYRRAELVRSRQTVREIDLASVLR